MVPNEKSPNEKSTIQTKIIILLRRKHFGQHLLFLFVFFLVKGKHRLIPQHSANTTILSDTVEKH